MASVPVDLGAFVSLRASRHRSHHQTLGVMKPWSSLLPSPCPVAVSTNALGTDGSERARGTLLSFRMASQRAEVGHSNFN